MDALCERFPELEIADLGVKFVKGRAKGITREQQTALLSMIAALGIAFEEDESEETPIIDDGMEDVPINLDCMTVPQLLEFARVNGIDIGGATKKANILQAIVDAASKEALDDGEENG